MTLWSWCVSLYWQPNIRPHPKLPCRDLFSTQAGGSGTSCQGTASLVQWGWITPTNINDWLVSCIGEKASRLKQNNWNVPMRSTEICGHFFIFFFFPSYKKGWKYYETFRSLWIHHSFLAPRWWWWSPLFFTPPNKSGVHSWVAKWAVNVTVVQKNMKLVSLSFWHITCSSTENKECLTRPEPSPHTTVPFRNWKRRINKQFFFFF